MMTIASSLVPMVTNIWLLYVCGFLFGFGSSAYVSGSVVWTMHIVGNKGRTLLQILDFAFSVGCVICTVVINPYLVGDLSTDTPINKTNSLNLSYQDQIVDPNDIDRRSRLMWSVFIIGFCLFPG